MFSNEPIQTNCLRTRETLGFENVSQDREQRSDESADNQTKKKLKHLEIRPLLVSTAAVRRQFTISTLYRFYGELRV